MEVPSNELHLSDTILQEKETPQEPETSKIVIREGNSHVQGNDFSKPILRAANAPESSLTKSPSARDQVPLMVLVHEEQSSTTTHPMSPVTNSEPKRPSTFHSVSATTTPRGSQFQLHLSPSRPDLQIPLSSATTSPLGSYLSLNPSTNDLRCYKSLSINFQTGTSPLSGSLAVSQPLSVSHSTQALHLSNQNLLSSHSPALSRQGSRTFLADTSTSALDDVIQKSTETLSRLSTSSLSLNPRVRENSIAEEMVNILMMTKELIHDIPDPTSDSEVDAGVDIGAEDDDTDMDDGNRNQPCDVGANEDIKRDTTEEKESSDGQMVVAAENDGDSFTQAGHSTIQSVSLSASRDVSVAGINDSFETSLVEEESAGPQTVTERNVSHALKRSQIPRLKPGYRFTPSSLVTGQQEPNLEVTHDLSEKSLILPGIPSQNVLFPQFKVTVITPLDNETVTITEIRRETPSRIPIIKNPQRKIHDRVWTLLQEQEQQNRNEEEERPDVSTTPRPSRTSVSAEKNKKELQNAEKLIRPESTHLPKSIKTTADLVLTKNGLYYREQILNNLSKFTDYRLKDTLIKHVQWRTGEKLAIGPLFPRLESKPISKKILNRFCACGGAGSGVKQNQKDGQLPPETHFSPYSQPLPLARIAHPLPGPSQSIEKRHKLMREYKTRRELELQAIYLGPTVDRRGFLKHAKESSKGLDIGIGGKVPGQGQVLQPTFNGMYPCHEVFSVLGNVHWRETVQAGHVGGQHDSGIEYIMTATGQENKGRDKDDEARRQDTLFMTSPTPVSTQVPFPTVDTQADSHLEFENISRMMIAKGADFSDSPVKSRKKASGLESRKRDGYPTGSSRGNSRGHDKTILPPLVSSKQQVQEKSFKDEDPSLDLLDKRRIILSPSRNTDRTDEVEVQKEYFPSISQE